MVVQFLGIDICQIVQSRDEVWTCRYNLFIRVSRFVELLHLAVDHAGNEQGLQIIRLLCQNGVHLVKRFGRVIRVQEGRDQKIVGGGQVRIQIDSLQESRLRQIKLFLGKIKFPSQVVPNSGLGLFLKNFIDSAMTGRIVFARNIEVDKLLEERWIIRCQLRCFLKSFARFSDFVLLLQNDAEQKVGGSVLWRSPDLLPNNGDSVVQSAKGAIGFRQRQFCS